MEIFKPDCMLSAGPKEKDFKGARGDGDGSPPRVWSRATLGTPGVSTHRNQTLYHVFRLL